MESLSVAECRRLLTCADPEELPPLLRRFGSDPRAGVRQAVASAQRRLAEHGALVDRWTELTSLEVALRTGGAAIVAGLDEVGLGALAGPLTAAAVVLDPERPVLGLDDSKRLSAARRASLADTIRSRSVSFCVAHVDAVELDRIGVTAAVRKAMCEAVSGLAVTAEHVVVDGRPVAIGKVPQTAVVGGDATVAAVAAASIIAKVERDELMVRLADEHPGYRFDRNKGYGSAEHLSAISRMGPSPVHRRSYAPCAGTGTLF